MRLRGASTFRLGSCGSLIGNVGNFFPYAGAKHLQGLSLHDYLRKGIWTFDIRPDVSPFRDLDYPLRPTPKEVFNIRNFYAPMPRGNEAEIM